MGTLSYIRNFIKDPKVASITPTSRYTIEKICSNIDFSKDIRILEFGPADGVFTKVLLKMCTPGSSVIAIETNVDFVKSLENINDERLSVYNVSAEKADQIVKSMGWESVDYILSGIPFSFLSENEKDDILAKSAALINNNGAFLGYQTSSHLKPFLSTYFRKVSTQMEYRNIPPMCIYVAQK